MTNALERVYASNADTRLVTIEFEHSSLSGGSLRLVMAYEDLEATLEDSSEVTFTAAAINIKRPQISTEGRQDLDFTIDNTNSVAWTQLNLAIKANRISSEKIICRYREFIESDTSAPASAVYEFTVNKTTTNRSSVTFRAGYTPLPDIQFPRLRYFPTIYPGIKYV